MPNRYLRESILTSDRVNQLDAQSEVFYRRLMSVVDDFGRFDGRPAVIKAATFPLRSDSIREADISRWLAICEKAGLIVVYEVESKPILELFNLGEPRAKTSKYPPRNDPRASVNICAQTHTNAPSSSAPSITPSVTSTSTGEAPVSPHPGRPKTDRDRLRDAVAGEFNLTLASKSDYSRIGKVVADLLAKGATPVDIGIRAARYRKAWPRVTCTPEALAKHWGNFDADEALADDEDEGMSLVKVRPTIDEIRRAMGDGE